MAQHPQIKPGRNPAALAARDNPALNQTLSAYEARALENAIEGHAFSEACRREQEQKEAEDQAAREAARAEQKTTNQICEGVELIAAPVAGVVSLWQTEGGRGVGRATNWVLGLGAKAVSAWGDPKSRAAQIATRGTKVLVHSQMSIDTREFIRNKFTKDKA